MSTEKVRNYLLGEAKQTPKNAELNIEKLSRHPDILDEFCRWIDARAFPKDAIRAEGHTAESLEQTTCLSVLGAYNYLIYLREKPEDAIKNLKAGLPRK
jgi:hypothetical protein